MYMSFHVGTIGAQNSLERLSVISNNLANINNTGFKPKSVAFSELINYNLNDSPEAVTELQAGAGMKVARTYTDFHASAVTQTGNQYNFAIMQDNAFFMVQDPATDEISYTRNGDFHSGEMDGEFYLTAQNGKFVLDADGEPIRVDQEGWAQNMAVFSFENPSRLISIGDNEYVHSDGDVEAIEVENPQLVQSALENSGTDLSKEMVNMIESQKAFSYAVKMVTTSDEVIQTINSLRG
ncbi:MAG: flagellar hook basal-body protein [Lachnospiraceae bacterium]|nr:flagellar hook basal-body protein [Lachnospiraceae bacterium]